MISVSTDLPSPDQRTPLDLLNQSLSLTAQSQGTMLGELFYFVVRAGVEWSGVAILIGTRKDPSDLVDRFGCLISGSHPIHSYHSTRSSQHTWTTLILRLIPDGAITAAHFIKTPYYVQIHGFWDGTSMNIVRPSFNRHVRLLTLSPREILEESSIPTVLMLSETLSEVTSPLTSLARMSSTRR